VPRKQHPKGGSRKIGRSLIKCARYRANKTRERNKLRKLKKLVTPKNLQMKAKIRELEEYIYGKTE
jgi:hypothetical protein